MTMTQQQFFEDFLENADFENATQGITVSRMNVHTEPMNWCGGIKVRQMTARSEVDIVIQHGLIRYGFVYALTTEVGYGDIEFANTFTLDDLKPVISLDFEVLESYSASLTSDDAATSQLIQDIFGFHVDDNTVHNPETNRSVEYLLRKAVVAKLNDMLEERLGHENFDNQFVRNMSEVAKNGLEVATSAMKSMLEYWSSTTPNNVKKRDM